MCAVRKSQTYFKRFLDRKHISKLALVRSRFNASNGGFESCRCWFHKSILTKRLTTEITESTEEINHFLTSVLSVISVVKTPKSPE